MTHASVPEFEPVELSAVRVKMGEQRPAPQPDPLGRELLGFTEGLSPAELWERGRGVWKAKVTALAESDLAILAVAGRVVMVGTVDGVTFHDDRVAVSGRPLPAHPLIGGPDPLHNDSRNPLTYGRVRTLPASAFPTQRPYEQVAADADRILTEAAKLRRPAYRQTSTGSWEQHPTATEPVDWAEFVTQALVAAAANVGGIDTALAGRPGSWEADGVRQLIAGTVGEDEKYLWRHRTEPLTITVHVDDILTGRTHVYGEYDAAGDEIERQREAADAAAEDAFDESAYLWIYDRGDGGGSDGEWIPRDPDAPAWSWEAWRADLVASVASDADPDMIDRFEQSLRTGVGLFTDEPDEVNTAYLSKTPAAAAELRRLEAQDDERSARYDELAERLEQQRLREWSDYGEALKAHIEAAVPQVLPGLQVPVEVGVDIYRWPDDGYATGHGGEGWTLQDRLIEAAVEATPTPADLPGTPLERLQSRSAEQENGDQS